LSKSHVFPLKWEVLWLTQLSCETCAHLSRLRLGNPPSCDLR
jgi:hypothetical protein